MSPLHAPGKDRAGGSRGASPGSETLSPGEADLAVWRRGEAWGWEAINPSPAVYPCWSRHQGDRALAHSVCWWGDRKPADPGLAALPEVGRGPRSGQDRGRRGAVCSLRCVVSKGLSLRNWRRSWGTQHAVKGRKHVSGGRQTSAKALWQEPPLSLRGQSRTRGGRWGQVSGWGWGVVCAWRVAWGLASPGKEFGFCSLLWDEECGEFGISLPLSEEHSCFFVCQPSARMSWWRPETRSEAVAGAQVTRCDLLVWGEQQRGGGRGHVLSGF